MENPQKIVKLKGTLRPPYGTRHHVTTGVFSPATKGCDCYNGSYRFVANPPIVPIRHAQADDLAAVVAIYNAAIPGRMATADVEPVTVESRRSWFDEFDPSRRPLWIHSG